MNYGIGIYKLRNLKEEDRFFCLDVIIKSYATWLEPWSVTDDELLKAGYILTLTDTTLSTWHTKINLHFAILCVCKAKLQHKDLENWHLSSIGQWILQCLM